MTGTNVEKLLVVSVRSTMMKQRQRPSVGTKRSKAAGTLCFL